MRCYRRLPTIKAISFDLDDTLYDNWPVLQKAEQAQLAFLHQHVPQSIETTEADWMAVRRRLAINNPWLCHDIGQWRQQGIYHGLLKLGLANSKAKSISREAFDVFYLWRNKIELSTEVHKTLEQLANRYPLIALTNGNASIEAIGLAGLFKFAIAAGDNGLKQKPHPDMFDVALQRLNIQKHQLLHIGDSMKSDVQGALNAGCSAIWFNPNGKTLTSRTPLPHLEISHLNKLLYGL